jgi:chemotaxis signal transduction protein
MGQTNSDSNFDGAQKYSIIDVCGKHFGIEISNVTEIVPMPGFTKLPNVGSEIKGIFNLRGKIYSIIDTRILLGIKKKSQIDKPYVVVLKSAKFSFGILADKVMDVAMINSNTIKSVPANVQKSIAPFITGVTKIDKSVTLYFLNIEAIINSEKIIQYRFNGN